jgi:hypothetical protein
MALTSVETHSRLQLGSTTNPPVSSSAVVVDLRGWRPDSGSDGSHYDQEE